MRLISRVVLTQGLPLAAPMRSISIIRNAAVAPDRAEQTERHLLQITADHGIPDANIEVQEWSASDCTVTDRAGIHA